MGETRKERAKPEPTPASLEASVSALHSLIEYNADGILVLRQNGTICMVNPAAEKLLGRSRDSLIGQPFGTPVTAGATTEIDLLGPSSSPRLPRVRVAEVRSQAVNWEGEPAFLVSLREITERKRDEDALRFLSDASRILADSLDEATTLENITRLTLTRLCDGCRIDRVNETGEPALVSITHNDPARLARLTPEQAKRSGLACRVALTGQRQVLFREEINISLPLSILGATLAVGLPLTARGQTFGVLTLIWTESQPVLEPRDLAVYDDFARRAAAALEHARVYREAQDESQRRSDFLAVLGHELRNPLSAIRNAMELPNHKDKGARALQIVARQAEHMTRLVDDLLDVSRITRGLVHLRHQTVDLRDILNDAIDTVRPLLNERQHQLDVDLPTQPLWVNGDPTRLEQIFWNLLHNAGKYTHPKGKIRLRSVGESGHLITEVSDNGIGIAAESLSRIFQMFLNQSQNLARSSGGLGIGLTLVRSLAELHGGTVTAFSEGPNRGSRFVVRLPASAAPPPLARPHSKPLITSEGRKILLVEDGEDNRQMLAELIGMWGHKVTEAADGPSGLAAVARESPEVALIDIGLPLLDGYAVARHIRANEPPGKRIFLIAMTGYGQPEDRQRALTAGFDIHLVKPMNLKRLSRLLDTLDPSED